MGRDSYAYRALVEESKSIEINWLKRQGYLIGWKYGGIKWGEANSISIGVSTMGVERAEDKKTVEEIKPEGNYIKLTYTQTDNTTGEKTDLDYKIPLEAVKCNFGNVRYYFRCGLVIDGKHCNRRVEKIYLPSGQKYFGCRHCYKLSYEARREHRSRFEYFSKVMKTERAIEKLYEQGETRKARKKELKLVLSGMQNRALTDMSKLLYKDKQKATA